MKKKKKRKFSIFKKEKENQEEESPSITQEEIVRPLNKVKSKSISDRNGLTRSKSIKKKKTKRKNPENEESDIDSSGYSSGESSKFPFKRNPTKGREFGSISDSEKKSKKISNSKQSQWVVAVKKEPSIEKITLDKVQTIELPQNIPPDGTDKKTVFVPKRQQTETPSFLEEPEDNIIDEIDKILENILIESYKAAAGKDSL